MIIADLLAAYPGHKLDDVLDMSFVQIRALQQQIERQRKIWAGNAK